MSTLRGYLLPEELDGYGINIPYEDETDQKISLAEQLIDSYVGYQERAVNEVPGEVSSVDGTTIFDTGGGSSLHRPDGYFTGSHIEIVDGTGAGQVRRIESSSQDAQSITVDLAFDTEPDTTSIFLITQVGKFPRAKDTRLSRDGTRYYRRIPQAVKDATAAQLEFIIEQGDDYFAGNGADMDAERLLSYSYQRSQGSSASSSSIKLISPKARTLLRGIKNSTGYIEREAN